LTYKLKHLHIPDSAEIDGQKEIPKSFRLASAMKKESVKNMAIHEDNYHKCMKIAESMQAYKAFLEFLKNKDSFSQEMLAEKKMELF
jgi:hypothetical protein